MIYLEYFFLYLAKFSLEIMLCSAFAIRVIFKESEQSGYAKHLRTTGVDLPPGGIMLWRSVYVCSPPAPSSPVQCFYHHHNYYNAMVINYITCMVQVRIMLWLSHTIFTIFLSVSAILHWPNVVNCWACCTCWSLSKNTDTSTMTKCGPIWYMPTTSCSALPPRYCIVTICMVQVGIMLWGYRYKLECMYWYHILYILVPYIVYIVYNSTLCVY